MAKCFFCGQEILDESELSIQPVQTYNKKRIYNRKFHRQCYPKFVDKRKGEMVNREEKQKWDKLYGYVKGEILGMKEGNLEEHIVRRLLGLKDGKYYPNHSVVVCERGYSLDVILLTFKFCKMDILGSIGNKDFKDRRHKFDYIMKIVTSNINDVFERTQRYEKSKEKTSKVDTSTFFHEGVEYKRKEDSIVGDLLEDLW